MGIKGNVGTVSAGGDRAHTGHHPPILGSRKVKVNNGIYPAGLIVKEDGAGDLVPYDGATDTDPIVAVIDEPVDTAENSSAITLEHGTARKSVIKIKAVGDAAEAADIKKLATIGIYAV